MTLTLDLPDELEARLKAEAARLDLSVAEYALRLLSTCPSGEPAHLLAQPDPARMKRSGVRRTVGKAPSARELLTLPPEERDRVLAAQAEDAEPLYRGDLKRPPGERELTALTALDDA